MSQICVRYLLLDDLENDHEQTAFDVQNLLIYSAEHWPDHVRQMSSSSQGGLQDLLYRLYDTSTTRFALWFPIFWRAMGVYAKIPKMDAIHLAAFNGHRNVVQSLIRQNKRSIHLADSIGITALT